MYKESALLKAKTKANSGSTASRSGRNSRQQASQLDDSNDNVGTTQKKSRSRGANGRRNVTQKNSAAMSADDL